MKKISLFLNHCIALCGLVALLSMSNQKAVGQQAFVTTWKTNHPGPSADNQITIPGVGTNYSIVWENLNNSSIQGTTIGNNTTTVTFPVAGTYLISISGNFHRMRFNNTGDRQKLLTIERWGNTVWSSMEGAFSGCDYLTYNAPDAPNLSNVTSMAHMFSGCTNFNGAIGSWNTSQVTDMRSLFHNASTFNQSIGGWNTSQVTNMNAMFQGAAAFNRPIDNWSTNNVVIMRSMFAGAVAFNQPIGNWNTNNVTTMQGMFSGAVAFNQSIGGWNTSQVTTMYAMFRGAMAFNQPVGNWNTSNVVNMEDLFYEASTFNQPIGGWNTSSVTNMNYLFSRASAFNQPIGNWNTSQVTKMAHMFFEATSFNQPLGNWNTSQVTTMYRMFYGASAFNKSLGSWDITQVGSMTIMLHSCGMDVSHYDQTLIGWESQNVRNNVSLGANGLMYCEGASARSNLISQHNWTITGDSQVACGAPAITIYQGKTTIPNNGVYNMGTVAVNGTSKEVDFDLRNTGTADLVLTGQPGSLIQVAGHTDDFTVTQNQVTSPIAPQDQRVFQVRFHPTVIGARSIVLFMQHNATGGVYRMTLTGNGQNVPDIHLRQGKTDLPSGSAFYMNNPGDYKFEIQNLGAGDLILGGAINERPAITISGPHAKDFKVIKISRDRPIAPGSKDSFVIQFSPQAFGERNATLTILSNDPDEGTYLVKLIGRSLLDISITKAPQMQVAPNPTTDQLTLSSEQWLEQNVSISIQNTQGRSVATQTIKQAQHNIDLDVSKYKSGWYILTVHFNKTRLEYRFMKR